ncbi:rRNA pseudouridine synthase [Cellulophaga baltica]|uniref:pseudouridine synthase n=1 Tax=Cellulophaga TaxID=104264 RepID=UPI001C068BCA|nr:MULTISPECIES: pseudouridine synthase [Cellulophaga]MBU2995507.1 rRNA pseudouridine synthase [Cellulophaga baltica]MDO6766901.1 pseudouridine synthase [Cellulophaga sp. 1_MG-2023]
MSRSDSNNDNKASGRQGGTFRKKSYARGNSPVKKNVAPKKPSNPNILRLNRYVANSGVCSRREADIFIAAGSVTVNGKAVTEMGYKVNLTDEVKFDGRLLNPIKKEYIILNKPKDFVTVSKDGRGNRSAMGLISNATRAKLLPVGKMDKSSMGLMLFTNDGELSTRLNSPKNGLRKIYHVELTKPFKSADLKRVQDGLMVEEKIVRVQDISYIDNAPKNQVGIEIYSTRNNIVRRLFEELDYELVKLDLVVYAGITKKDLPRGHWRPLTEQEVINLGMIK